ncbi:MAG: phosphatidate cytidylyltransferase [Hyphomicrobiaceae bacterium]
MDEGTVRPRGGGLPADLVPRLVSGVVLASLTVGLAYAGGLPFAALVFAVGVLMSWEWGRIVRGTGIDAVFAVHAAAVAGAVVLAGLGFAVPALIVLAVGAAVVALLCVGEAARLSALGVVYAGLPAVSLLWLRGDDWHGFLAVVFVLLAAWTTDTAAYIAGRAIGGPKLYPRVSPNKTWAGLIGGVAASSIVGALFAWGVGTPVHTLTIAAFAFGLLTQAGDLLESALKRRFGVKDASSLIPGHGGFLDRIDGLIVAAAGAAIFALAVNPQAPAQALLFWR